MPDGSGIDFVKQLNASHSNIYCIVVTILDDNGQIFAALKAGADGYLFKSQDKDILIQLLQDILDGSPPLSPSIARHILKYFYNPSMPNATPDAVLTRDEKQVLQSIAQGMTRDETAQLLGIQSETVAGYIKHVYEMLRSRD